jgi:hypothetical protein
MVTKMESDIDVDASFDGDHLGSDPRSGVGRLDIRRRMDGSNWFACHAIESVDKEQNHRSRTRSSRLV